MSGRFQFSLRVVSTDMTSRGTTDPSAGHTHGSLRMGAIAIRYVPRVAFASRKA